MMDKKKVYNIIVFLLAGIILGIIIKYWSSLSFDFEISVFDVFTLIVTAFLAWWVAEKLEKGSTMERCEKDILIEKIKMMDNFIESIQNKIVSSEAVPLSDVNELIHKFDILSTRVSGVIEQRYSSLFEDEHNDYRNDLDGLDDLCTNDELEGMPNSISIEDRDGISTCTYTMSRKEAIDDVTSSISDKLFALQILLNRA